MVSECLACSLQDDFSQEVELENLPVKYFTVKISDVIAEGKRLEASVFDAEAMHARQMIYKGKYQAVPLIGKNSPVKKAYYGDRLKRNYVERFYPQSLGFVGSSEMLDCYPQPVKFMRNEDRINDLHVRFGDILISRSGTIGNLTFVGKTLEKLLVSEHAIRLLCSLYPGYVYTFLKSRTGQMLIRPKKYGAVVNEIEPEHLATIPIPDAPVDIKKRIHDLIVRSYQLRDESNDLIDEATTLIKKELHFPEFEDFKIPLYKKNAIVDTFNIKLSSLAGRVDASYHVPIVSAIVNHMKQFAAEVTNIGDKRVSKDVVLPGRFKRIYVEEKYGVKFLGGKEIHQLNPTSEKYLSFKAHKRQLEGALGIKENSILTPARGSLGEVVLPSKQFLSWAISDNMMQILSYKDICGYVYIFLNTLYGRELIKRFTYGSVVDAIEPMHIKNVEIPFLKNKISQQCINDLALESNEKRFEAYKLEQQALQIMDSEVLFAQ